MKKRSYKSVKVNEVVREKLFEMVRGSRLVVGNDVAKKTHVAALMGEDRRVLLTIRWDMPDELGSFVSLLQSLPVSSLCLAMEPSGSYGDPLRFRLWESGIEVHRVSPKRTHDVSEYYDGVPSSHDAKSAAVIAAAYWDGASEVWPVPGESERELKSLVGTMDRYASQVQQNVNRLEGVLGSVWPELGEILDLTSVTLWKLLAEFGGPAGVAADPKEARHLLRKTGGGFLAEEKINQVVSSARLTSGCPMTAGERQELSDLAEDTFRAHQQVLKWKRKVHRQCREDGPAAAMSSMVGLATSAVLVSELGDPGKYASAKAYEKAAGLNLKERSSGKHQGEKRITKRGSGTARRWLYLAVWRLVQKNAAFGAWYERKVARDGGRSKNRAIVALMRKLIRALWHVGQGEAFDESKLFDLRRLKLA